MEITKCMTRDVVTVRPSDTLRKAKHLMLSGGFRQLPVLEDDRVLGILSGGDIRRHGHLAALVDQAMTPNPITIEVTSTVEQAVRLLLRFKINALLVVASGKSVGLLSTSDVLQAFLDIEEQLSSPACATFMWQRWISDS